MPRKLLIEGNILGYPIKLKESSSGLISIDYQKEGLKDSHLTMCYNPNQNGIDIHRKEIDLNSEVKKINLLDSLIPLLEQVLNQFYILDPMSIPILEQNKSNYKAIVFTPEFLNYIFNSIKLEFLEQGNQLKYEINFELFLKGLENNTQIDPDSFVLQLPIEEVLKKGYPISILTGDDNQMLLFLRNNFVFTFILPSLLQEIDDYPIILILEKLFRGFAMKTPDVSLTFTKPNNLTELTPQFIERLKNDFLPSPNKAPITGIKFSEWLYKVFSPPLKREGLTFFPIIGLIKYFYNNNIDTTIRKIMS